MRLLRSPYGYLAAVAVVLSGWILGTVVAAGAWDSVRNATLTPVTEKRADADGKSVAVFTDIVQPERDVRCRVRDTKDVATNVPAGKIDIIVEDQGTEWQLVGLLPRGRDGLKVRCAPTADERADNATYTYAIVDGFRTRGRNGQILAMGGLFGGIAVAAATYFTRKSAKEKVDA